MNCDWRPLTHPQTYHGQTLHNQSTGCTVNRRRVSTAMRCCSAWRTAADGRWGWETKTPVQQQSASAVLLEPSGSHEAACSRTTALLCSPGVLLLRQPPPCVPLSRAGASGASRPVRVTPGPDVPRWQQGHRLMLLGWAGVVTCARALAADT